MHELESPRRRSVGGRAHVVDREGERRARLREHVEQPPDDLGASRLDDRGAVRRANEQRGAELARQPMRLAAAGELGDGGRAVLLPGLDPGRRVGGVHRVRNVPSARDQPVEVGDCGRAGGPQIARHRREPRRGVRVRWSSSAI